MGVDFNTNKGDLTVQVRKGYGISMCGEREVELVACFSI
jgi:hypothetical protein